MDPEILDALSMFFGDLWRVFTDTPIPYTNLSFGQLYIGLFASSVFIAFLHKVLDHGASFKSGKGDYKKVGEKDDSD